MTIDLKRAGMVTLLIAVPLFLLLTTCGVLAIVEAQDNATRIVGYVVTALFLLPVLMVPFAYKRLRKPHGLRFDERGILYWQGNSSMLLPWAELAGVGIGYEQPPHLPALSVEAYVGDKVKEAIKLDGKRRFASILARAKQRAAAPPRSQRVWQTDRANGRACLLDRQPHTPAAALRDLPGASERR